MKTPTARKLPSGAWTCRVRAGGKDISITRPTEKAAVAEAMAIKAGVIEASRTSPSAKTIREAIDDYISARSAVLSPSTIRGYRIIQNNRFQGIMARPLKSLSDTDFQRAVNRESRECGAKTVKNAWGLIRSAVQSETGRTVTVRLPPGGGKGTAHSCNQSKSRSFLTPSMATDTKSPCCSGFMA